MSFHPLIWKGFFMKYWLQIFALYLFTIIYYDYTAVSANNGGNLNRNRSLHNRNNSSNFTVGGLRKFFIIIAKMKISSAIHSENPIMSDLKHRLDRFWRWVGDEERWCEKILMDVKNLWRTVWKMKQFEE